MPWIKLEYYWQYNELYKNIIDNRINYTWILLAMQRIKLVSYGQYWQFSELYMNITGNTMNCRPYRNITGNKYLFRHITGNAMN